MRRIGHYAASISTIGTSIGPTYFPEPLFVSALLPNSSITPYRLFAGAECCMADKERTSVGHCVYESGGLDRCLAGMTASAPFSVRRRDPLVTFFSGFGGFRHELVLASFVDPNVTYDERLGVLNKFFWGG